MEKLKTNPMAATGGPKYADPVCCRLFQRFEQARNSASAQAQA
jgi:hypothetical protein